MGQITASSLYKSLASQKLLPFYQGCQLLRIAWSEEPKHEKTNILQFFLASASAKLCINFNFKKMWQKKVMFSLMREILHAWWDVSHSCGRYYMFGVRAWETVSRSKTHAQCVRVDSPEFATLHVLYFVQESGLFFFFVFVFVLDFVFVFPFRYIHQVFACRWHPPGYTLEL